MTYTHCDTGTLEPLNVHYRECLKYVGANVVSDMNYAVQVIKQS